ncbi:MAG: ThuA domain-containing protein [Verrucomicrobiae bacterium]|nr:ThuA domain-containing protein [Verrucomicrobiae bacterium]
MNRTLESIRRASLVLGLMLSCASSHARLSFQGKSGPGEGLNIVLIAGDEEYRTEESCPMLAKILSQRHGFNCTVLFSMDPSGRYIDPSNQKSVTSINQLDKADLVIIGTRFRQWPDEDYRHLADFLNAGKPVIGFRTATHAFTGKGKTGDFAWNNFGLKILGERWVAHHGRHKSEGTRGVIEEKNARHPVLNGVKDVFGPSDVYTIKNLDQNAATILLRGAVTDSLDPKSKAIDGPKNNPMMPIAWLRDYTAPNGTTTGKAFCTTMGASTDFVSEDLRRLLVNAVYHLLGKKIPAKADVTFVDPFHPSSYGFNNAKDYYKDRNLRINDLALGKSASTDPKINEKNNEAPKAAAPKPAKPDPKEGLPTYPQAPASKSKPAAVKLPLKPGNNETIALVGNMLGERMLYFGHFETLLHQRFPEQRLVLRNLCNPGDTPGFRPNSSRFDPWAFPGAEKFNQNKKTHYGIGHYPSPDEWLHEVRADTIIGFFGYNESFDGPAGLDNFKAELTAWIDHTHSLAYNGETPPRVVLATPIAFENRQDAYDLPDGSAENKRIAAYAQAIKEVANAKKVGVIDLFSISKKWFSEKGSKLTINGCHLADAGYRKLAPVLADRLFGPAAVASKADPALLREAVIDKDWFWFNDYRMLNGVHVYGRRWKPYGNVNYPEEIEKMRQMTRLRDERIQDVAIKAPKTLPQVADELTRTLTPVETNFKRPIEYLGREKAIEKFTIRDDFQIELFASESEFPDLRNPVQMSFDNKGRLWVAVLPSYPHYKPGGEKPNDKLLIFEDTDGDGRADRQKVFAEGLNLPIGFEFAPEGVYLSQEPHLCLLVDDDKDDRADRMEIILSGFDSHDTHHAISAYCADPSGSFYLCEGRFLHSQVETPYGPERMTDGGVWRFDPRRYKLERYSQADYNNPWGITFDYWEQGYISDASSGMNYWGLPVSAKIPHGLEIPKVDEFAPKRSRPTSGTEFVSSRHFPDDLQGHFMICNSIGFLGTSLHDIWEEGSGFHGKHIGDLVSSSDPNFRPVDLEFAPDGSLYIVDWHNALIGHMQHNARDPNRDTDHGRIYRVTHKTRPLVKPATIAGASIPDLLDNLKLPEYRTRYRTRRELAAKPAAEVLPAVTAWAARLNRKDPQYEHHLCEALWVTWAQNKVDANLLKQCLYARAHQARAAAVHVLRYAHDQVKNSGALFLQAANDPHPRVRLEAIVAASWLDNATGARIVLESLRHSFDRWMGPVTEMILKDTLADDISKLNAAGKLDLASNPNAKAWIDGKYKFAKMEPSAETKSYGPTAKLSESDTAIYKLGEEIFRRDAHCATCHQHNGQGTPNIYPPLIMKDNPWLGDNDERLIKIVLKGLWGPFQLHGQTFDPSKGVPPMPGFGGILNDTEIAAVINYVRNSFGNQSKFIQPGDVAKVRKQVADRADFYLVEDIMKQHPIPGWEQWQKAAAPPQSFE